jgi:diguanylate cyclase (GGDEF)-like protein/PAS domain S-box-containing protein
MAARPAASQSTGDIISRLVLVGVGLIGILAIAGWHLHLRMLVQVFAGSLPMQYNTALCWIALAASGLILVRGRGPRFAVVLGGSFVALMGALVIYQSAAHRSLGIDTLFFYPWIRTLSADPGRMALTTAISFLTAGVALIIISFRRSATAAFAILHTVPLSLGMTSVMGYLVGITFVLPFNLGTQMAVHAAVAFLGYGGVMLLYAWRHGPHTAEGVPRWVPATGILMVPILFVGISISAQRTSTLAGTILVVMGVMAAGLFGMATQRLNRSSINQKGLILVSIPLAFLFVFVLLVARLSRQSARAEAAYLESKEVIAAIETISTDLFDAESSTRGYVITGDAGFANSFERPRREVADAVTRLKTLVHDNSEQQARISEICAIAEQKLAFQERIEQLMKSGKHDEAVDLVRTPTALEVTNEFRAAKNAFLDEEQRRDEERRRNTEASWQQLNWLLVAGSSIDVFLAVVLAILFSAGISKRILALTQNAQALAKGEELADPVKGNDEIGHLDHVFHEMADALQEAAKRERAIFENALEVICTIDREGKFVRVSPSSFKVWGYRPQELIGKGFAALVVAEEMEKTEQARRETLTGKSLTDFENRYRRKDGSVVDMLWSAWWSETDQATFAMGRDITERKRAEHYLAYYDSLTGLPNRTLFEERLPQALSRADRNHRTLGIMFLDLDRFKTVNDTLGHRVGDQLIRGVAERLKMCLSADDTVARFGGDAFALLLTQLNRSEDIARTDQHTEEHPVEVAQTILNALKSSFKVADHELFVTASIGISVYPHDGTDPQALLKNAGAALSRVKERGGNSYRFYAAHMNAKALHQLTLENGLRRALARDEFLLYYQPQVDLKTGRILAVEALLRWNHPELGFIAPADFIPLAERNGLIVPIGEWTLRVACAQAKRWHDEGLRPLRMSVNLSARQFEQPDLLEMIARVLAETGFDPSYLEFELTESSIMKNAERTIDTLHRLKAMHIQVAIDDFGSGYSSLSYLKRFPIDRLKIDQSFVQEATNDRTDAAIIMAILTLAQSLRLKVIAEGVETEEQMKLLHLLQCDEIQGFYFCQPLPTHELKQLLIEDASQLERFATA